MKTIKVIDFVKMTIVYGKAVEIQRLYNKMYNEWTRKDTSRFKGTFCDRARFNPSRSYGLMLYKNEYNETVFEVMSKEAVQGCLSPQIHHEIIR